MPAELGWLIDQRSSQKLQNLHHMTLINFPVIYDTKYYLKAIWLFLGLIMGIKLIYKLLSMG